MYIINNNFATDDTIECKYKDLNLHHYMPRKHFIKIFLENLEEMFPRY